jgi:hypothetical protein
MVAWKEGQKSMDYPCREDEDIRHLLRLTCFDPHIYVLLYACTYKA